MNHSEEVCCFCLKSSNFPFTNLFRKNRDGLTEFDKISSSFSQLASILNENMDHNFMLCCECCNTIEMIHQFNQKCLNSLEIYLSKKTITKGNNVDEDNDYQINIKSNLKIKTEFDEHKSGNANISESIHYEPEIKIETLENEMFIDPLNVPRKSKDLGSFSNCSSMEDIHIEEEQSVEQNEEDLFEAAEEKLHEIQENIEFSTQEQLFVQENANKKRFSCKECKKMFKYQNLLDLHMRLHSGVNPFQCNICDESFVQMDHLTAHMLVHRGPKSHKCEICNEIFKYRSCLKTHLLTHSGDKPYCCDQCDKRFSDKRNLYRHKRIHSGEKPFMCDMCEKTFTDKSNLNRHIRAHTK